MNEMSPIRLLTGFFRTYRRSIVICLLTPAAFIGMHLLGLGHMSDLKYTLLLVGLGLIAAWARSFARYVSRIVRLQDALRNLLPSEESIPECDGAIEEGYRALALAYQKRQNETLTQNAALEREQVDYYTLWIHQIKTPIAAMDLMAQSDEPIERKLLRQELFKVEQYADAALSYQRLQTLHKDLELCEVALYPLCCSVVKKLRTMFIYRRINLDLQQFDATALTDAKWLGMVLTQVLSNALKYTPEGGRISIELRAPLKLAVTDNGIGIRAEDVPRVFDRGFTGQIGRSSEKSTGIGLYLCKETCRKLGHDISLTSEPGRGTTVLINLSRRKYNVFS